jgi:ABC-type cobalamin/Fe3+-siderophores transport system ATPase subunit
MAIVLKVKDIECGYDKKMVIKGVSFEVGSGEVLCLLGPNGSGKSTLFKAILGFLPLKKGEILLGEKDLEQMSRADIAKSIGYVPQAHIPPFPFEAIDVVLMGRTAHLGAFESPKEKDVKMAKRAFEVLGASHLENKIYTEMSGGERQLVLIARALVSQPKILIMDEPTNNLDFGNQIMVLNHIKNLANQGMSIIMSSHYPEHAFLYSQKVLLLESGRVYSSGTPEKTVTEKSLRDLYGVAVNIMSTTNKKGEAIKVCVPMAC